MATPKIDNIANEFLKRIPDTFQTSFTPGGGIMPGGYVLKTATQIMDYVNRGMLSLFNIYWEATEGNKDLFLQIFPELQEFSDAVPLTNGNYTIAANYLNFKALIGAVKSSDNSNIEVWRSTIYTLALSGKYQFNATASKPAIIQVKNLLAVFPQSSSFQIKFHYIKLPLDPTTGLPLSQNGGYDSPFMDDWNDKIADIAYKFYLQEA